MKPKTMILMALAVVCGLGASYMTSRLLAERQPTEEEKVKILVARRPLSVGERIVKPEELFEIKEVTKENDPPDAIKDLELLKGKTLRQSRNRGDHITVGNLYEGGGLDIPEGHHAVGCPVNLATTAHGLATLPGSRVDVMLTVRGGRDVLDTASFTILQDVLVLAADARTNREGEMIAPASVVTFALKEKEKLIMTTAKDMGVLTLSLRKLNDRSAAKETRINGRMILSGKFDDEKPTQVAEAAPPPKPAPEVKPAPEQTVVQPPPVVEEPKSTVHSTLIINGERIQSLSYRRFENGDLSFDDGNPQVAPAPTPAPTPSPRQQQVRPQVTPKKVMPPSDF